MVIQHVHTEDISSSASKEPIRKTLWSYKEV